MLQLHRLTFWNRYSKAERIDIEDKESKEDLTKTAPKHGPLGKKGGISN